MLGRKALDKGLDNVWRQAKAEGRREMALELAEWCDMKRAEKFRNAEDLDKQGLGAAGALARQEGDIFFWCAAECRRRAGE